MTPFKFYFYFGISVELFIFFPILFAVCKWRHISLGIKFVVFFLVSELLINIVSYYFYFTGSYNLFLNYFYSFFQLVFMFLAFYQLLTKHFVRIIVYLSFIICLVSLIIDYSNILKVSYNSFSGILISVIITIFSGYYFATNILQVESNKTPIFTETNIRISLIMTLQFFIKSLNIFLEKIYFDTQNNPFLLIQMRNIYYYFMLVCLILYCTSFRNIKSI